MKENFSGGIKMFDPQTLIAACNILFPIFITVFGVVIGSFLNVVIYRTQHGESIAKGRSHCTSCGEQIKNRDLIPIFSWIFLGGKCRNCKAKISPRYMIVEALTGAMYLAAYLKFGNTIELIYAVVLFPMLIVLSFVDIDSMEIPYWTTITIAVLGIASIFTDMCNLSKTPAGWYEHLLGAVVIGIPFALLAFFGAMGGGDMQLMAAAGLLLGWKIVPAAAIGIFLGAIGGIIVLVKNRKKDPDKSVIIPEGTENSIHTEESADSTATDVVSDVESENDDDTEASEKKETDEDQKRNIICFGPFLAVGIAVAFMFGNEIINWYLGFL